MEKFYTFIPSLRLDNEGKNREINDKRRYIFKILLKQLIENNIVPVVCAQNYQDEDYLFPDKVIYFNEPKISVNYARNKLFEKWMSLKDSSDVAFFMDDDHIFDEVFLQRIDLQEYFKFIESHADKIGMFNFTTNGGDRFTTGLRKNNPWIKKNELVLRENRTGKFSAESYFLSKKWYKDVDFNYEYAGSVFGQEYTILETLRNKIPIYTIVTPVTDQPYKINSVLRKSYKESGTPFEERFVSNPKIVEYLKMIKAEKLVEEIDYDNFSYHPPTWMKLMKNYIAVQFPEPTEEVFVFNIDIPYHEDMTKNCSKYNRKYSNIKCKKLF